MLYRAPVDTSPVTEGVTLFKHQLLLNKIKTNGTLYPRFFPRFAEQVTSNFKEL